MPENMFGLGSPYHPDEASIRKEPRRVKQEQSFDPSVLHWVEDPDVDSKERPGLDPPRKPAFRNLRTGEIR